jgi:hypothetical protein
LLHIHLKNADYYTKGSGGSLLEKLISLRKYEDVLMDIASDDEGIHTGRPAGGV